MTNGAVPTGPSPDRALVMPLLDAVTLLLRESMRAHLRVRYERALPEACFSDTFLNPLIPEGVTKSLADNVAYHAPVRVPVLEQLDPGVSLTSRALSALVKLQPAEKSSFSLIHLNLNQALLELGSMERILSGPAWSVVYRLFEKRNLPETFTELQQESEPALLRLAVDMALYRQVERSGYKMQVMHCYNAEWIDPFTLHNQSNPAEFQSATETIVRSFAARKLQFHQTRMLALSDIPERTLAPNIPDLRLLVLPFRDGDLHYGTTVVAFASPRSPVAHDGVPMEIDWFVLRAGQLMGALQRRSVQLEALEATLPRLPDCAARVVLPREPFKAGGASVERVAVRIGDEVGVLFLSTEQSYGRSVPDVFEKLAEATLPLLEFTTLDKIRWFEFRDGEQTADGVPQSLSLHEVKHWRPTTSNPSWEPANPGDTLVRALLKGANIQPYRSQRDSRGGE